MARLQTYSNGRLLLSIAATGRGGQRRYSVHSVDLLTPQGRQHVAGGIAGCEFVATLGCADADTCAAQDLPGGGWALTLSASGDGWEARETITLGGDRPYLRREQTYRFTRRCEAGVCPGFSLPADPALRYTFPLRAHEARPAELGPMRVSVDWALPLPFHVWHTESFVAMYGVDRSRSPGTLDFTPPCEEAGAVVRVYYPDTGEPTPGGIGVPAVPAVAAFSAGTGVTIAEVIGAKVLAEGEEPLLEAERFAAELLLRDPPDTGGLPAVAARIAGFYRGCELWEPDALGPGRGWFSNMWVRTQDGPAKKRGEMSGYFDLGWGEGIAVETMLGAVRFWLRTGDACLLPYVDEMSRNIELFRRAHGADQPYFDRSDGKRFGDFLMDVLPGSRIWTHSLGHTGSQLLQLYQAGLDYPNPCTRRAWLAAARSIACFLAQRQRPDGDLPDIFDEQDREANPKPHRITARAVVCGLWARLSLLAGEPVWMDRALKLAAAVAPAIRRYEYHNQMLDGLAAPGVEFVDGEAAYYALEGLVPLYRGTRDRGILALCRKAAAFGFAWTYFYDVPKAYHGIARGGQCCRMDDLPLLYPVGPAKAMTPLLELYALTGDPLYETMAREAAAFIGAWQLNEPGRPWDGAMVHAVGQYCGKIWGPDLAGQADTGVSTGNGLAAIEAWMAHERSAAGRA